MSFAAFAHYGGAKDLGKVMEVLFIISKNGEGSRLKVEVTAKVAPIMYEIRGNNGHLMTCKLRLPLGDVA